MKNRIIVIGIVLVVGLVSAATLIARVRLDRLEGFYAPIFAATGEEIVFVHRETRGISRGLGYEHFSPPAHVYVLRDRFGLRRLDPGTGRVTALRALPASPFEGRWLRHYRGRLYGLPRVRLSWAENGELGYTIALRMPRQPTARTFGIRRRWNNRTRAMEESEDWHEGHFATGGYDEDGVGRETELLTPPGREHFPAAIVRYRPRAKSYTALLESDAHDDLQAAGSLLPWLEAHSRLAKVTRLRELRATRARLLSEFRARGLGEGEAILATNKEMQSGVFPDIERALAQPGAKIDKRGGKYLIHRGYDTSARLNAYLASGAAPFLVSYRNEAYMLTIERE